MLYLALPTFVYLLVCLALGLSFSATLVHLIRIGEKISKIRIITETAKKRKMLGVKEIEETQKEDELDISAIKKSGNVVPNVLLLAIQLLALMYLGFYFIDPITK